MKSRRSILKKTIFLGISTLASRVLGLAREFIKIRYLGVGMVADAFNTAFRLPSALQKIFAEGALTAALTPTLISVLRREGTKQASQLVTLTFLVIQAFLLLFCLLVSFNAPLIVSLMAPGFSSEAIAITSSLAAILIFFTLFVSASAMLGSALSAVQRFFVPANSQAMLNFLLVGQLMLCLYFKLSVTTLAWFIVFNGALITLWHFYAYRKAGFSLVWPESSTWHEFGMILKKFGPCIITAGSVEISLFIDGIMASYLPVGSISLLTYTSAFMRVPIGVFAIGFATILLPHMTHVALYAPKRLWYYLLESVKLVAWITIPVSLCMIAFSYKIFETMLVSDTFSVHDALRAGQLLSAFACGLFFFSLNKILVNMYYARHDTLRPTLISLIGTVINTLLNFFLMRTWGILGIVIATTASTVVQTVLFLAILHRSYKVSLPMKNIGVFLLRTVIQCIVFGLILYGIYYGIYYGMSRLSPAWEVFKMPASLFFTKKWGYWLWVGPLCATLGLLMYLTRRRFGIRIYFLDQQG